MKNLIFLIGCFIVLKSNSQIIRNVQYVQPMYELNLKKADSILRANPYQLSKSDIDLLRVQLNWWRSFCTNDFSDSLYQSSMETISFHTDSLEELNQHQNKKELTYRLFELQLMEAQFQLKGENYFSAVFSTLKCLNIYEALKEFEENVEEFRLVKAAYNYYMAYTREEYMLMRPFLMSFPEGDKEKGLSELRQLVKSENKELAAEALFYLSKIYLETENDPALASNFTHPLTERYPYNFFFGKYHIKALAKSGKIADAEKFQKECLVRLNKTVKGLTESQRLYFIDWYTNYDIKNQSSHN